MGETSVPDTRGASETTLTEEQRRYLTIVLGSMVSISQTDRQKLTDLIRTLDTALVEARRERDNAQLMIRTAMKAGRALEVTHQELTAIDREGWKQALDEAQELALDDLRKEVLAAEQARDAALLRAERLERFLDANTVGSATHWATANPLTLPDREWLAREARTVGEER